ncbi:MAG TPA: 50S ribosomal protein L25 [Anaerolineae bacterium]
MAERVAIDAERRSVTGKKVKQLRREGWIPAVIYGRTEPLHIQLASHELRRVLRDAGMTHLIDVDVDGSRRTVLAREIQRHVTRGDLIHVDFLEVDLQSTIKSDAELVSVGQALPTEDGLGVGIVSLRTVEIECLPDALISEIEVDLSRIETPDDVLYVRDLTVPVGVTILTDPDTAVARFEYTQLEEEEEEEEELFVPAADDVEVIGKGKEEEEEFEE